MGVAGCGVLVGADVPGGVVAAAKVAEAGTAVPVGDGWADGEGGTEAVAVGDAIATLGELAAGVAPPLEEPPHAAVKTTSAARSAVAAVVAMVFI